MRKGWRVVLITFMVLALVSLVAAACGDDGEPTHAHPAEFLAEGQALFSANCAGCHGAGAQGTDIGPDITGESESKVLKQVRKGDPGEMPAFTVNQISDEGVHKIGAFLESLD